MQENIAVVYLNRIRDNARRIGRLLPPCVKLYAVVKANAYGHGILPVAEAIEPLCDGFVVTSVVEGMFLRQGGIRKEVLVLTPPLDGEDVFYAATHDLTLTVCDFASAKIVVGASERFRLSPIVHLKVNTGMNRLGECGKSFRKVCNYLKSAGHARVQGIYSHLYCPSDRESALRQRLLFLSERAVAEERFGRLTAHLAASGGVLQGEEFCMDAVRVGICLYGYAPTGLEGAAQPLGLRPAMELYTHVLQSHDFIGGGIGYRQATKSYGRLSVCRLGYADGFFRGGGVMNAEGNLCMDSLILSGKGHSGQRKQVFSDGKLLAEGQGTIVYETLCNATRRASFEYRRKG